MPWYNPLSYFTADVGTAADTAKDIEATNLPPPQPPKEEGNPIALIFIMIFIGVFYYLFYANCRPVGQRMGKNGKMETIYDCTGSKPQPVMYAQPQPVMYAQPQPVMYAQPQPVMYAQPQPVMQQPGGIFGFGRRRRS